MEDRKKKKKKRKKRERCVREKERVTVELDAGPRCVFLSFEAVHYVASSFSIVFFERARCVVGYSRTYSVVDRVNGREKMVDTRSSSLKVRSNTAGSSVK